LASLACAVAKMPTTERAMRASALGSVLVMLGASGQHTKMKAGEPIG